MKNQKETWTVLSLGGSIVAGERIDTCFIKKFKGFIQRWLEKGKKFIIFVGGGEIARDYQEAARILGALGNQDLDQIGIEATYLNATLLRLVFKDLADQKILKDPREKLKTKKKIIIGGGFEPGWSTDFDAVLAAKAYGSGMVINLSNIDYLYDKDPKRFKDAKPLKEASFAELLLIIGKKWSPGANLPFDPKAVRLAKKEKMKVVILNGRKLKNLQKFFEGKNFKGTLIKP